MRVAAYADLLYAEEGGHVTTTTPFVLWLDGLAEHLDELVVLGRLHPQPRRALFELAGPAVRFQPLPYYPSLRDLGAVARQLIPSLGIFARELRGADVVLLFGPHPYAFAFAVLARLRRCPVVFGIRQDLPEYLAQRTTGWRRRAVRAVARALEAATLRLARGGVLAVGEEMAARYRRAGATVLETGLSLVRAGDVVSPQEARSRPWPGNSVVLVVGRLDPEKNPMLLPEIAAALRRLGPWRLEIAGSGSLEGALAELVARSQLGDVVTLLGRLDRAGLAAAWRRATVFLHVSLTEGQPQVLYEAAAAGVPIVATAVGGVPAALDGGRRGLLVPPVDVDAIVAAVQLLAEQPERRATMVEAALGWAASDTLDAQTTAVSSLLGELARARGRSRPRRVR